MSDRLEVSCAVEGDYALHSAAMLRSVLLQRGSSPVRIHLLHGADLGDSFTDRLRAMVESAPGCSISFIEAPDDLCAGLPTVGFTRTATWYRVFLPDLLPALDRVLSLDVDLVALRPLPDLWATDVDGAYLAAVTNVLAPVYRHRPRQLGMSPEDYFNAGVMLMNLARMRRDDRTATMVDYARRHADEMVLRDQDALNFGLAHSRVRLAPMWNAMNSIARYPWAGDLFSQDEITAAIATPAIRHFEGPDENKPWHFLADRGSREMYRSHRRETPWPDYELEGRTLSNRFRRLRRRGRYVGRRLSARIRGYM